MAGDLLTRERLPTADAVLTLGALVVRALQETGVATLFVNTKGEIEFCPRGELELDGLTEEEAIQRLLEKSYDDAQIVTYLKGREARGQATTTEG